MVNFQMEPVGLLLFVLLSYATKEGFAATIKCYEKTGVSTKVTITASILTTKEAAPSDSCDGKDDDAAKKCSIVYKKKGRETLKFGCKGCDEKTNYDSKTEKCITCTESGCNNYLDQGDLSDYKTAHDAYKQCISAEGDEPDLTNATEIYCTGGDKCQRSEYYNDKKKLQLFVGCASECAAAVKDKKGTDGKTEAKCKDCSLDDADKDKDDYCKKAQTVAPTEKSKTTTAPAGKGGAKSDSKKKSVAHRAAAPAAALVLASVSAIKLCIALL